MQPRLRNDDLLKFKIGVSRAELQIVWHGCHEALISHYEESHSVISLYPFAALLLTVYWIHLYPSRPALSVEFDIPEIPRQEYLTHTVGALLSILPLHLNDNNRPSHPQLTEDGSVCAVDSTWISIEEPRSMSMRGTYYHPKSQTGYGLKFQLAVHLNGFFWNVSNVVVGSTHDKRLFDETDLKNLLHPRLL